MAAMACVAKYHRPLYLLDENPKKRRKLTSSWDVTPSQIQAQQLQVFTVQDVGSGNRNGEGEVKFALSAGAESSVSYSNHSRPSSSTMKFKVGSSRNASPPWRSDDKDGHYMFELGENFTPRCNNIYFTSLLFI